jgi:hypothetical protein
MSGTNVGQLNLDRSVSLVISIASDWITIDYESAGRGVRVTPGALPFFPC